jgi:hypothetical protein
MFNTIPNALPPAFHGVHGEVTVAPACCLERGLKLP